MTQTWKQDERPASAVSTQLTDEHIKLALEVSRLGTWRIDVESGVLTCSDSCKANYGRGPNDSLTYEELASLVIEADRARWQDTVTEALSTGGAFEMEYGVRWDDGSPHWVFVRGSCRCDEAGRVVMMLGVSADITEQRVAREELSEVQARLEATLAAGDVATWTWDVVLDRVVADRNLARFFGVSEADAQGASIALYIDSIHPDDRERTGELIQAALKTGPRFEAKYRVRDAEGRYRTVVARGQVEYSEKGRPIRLPGVLIDVSREEQLRQDAEQANRAKDEFLAMLGHELRNPLAPISTALQLMKLRSEDMFVKERTVIERQVEHLTRLVDDLLDISRIISGKTTIQRTLLNLAEVIGTAIEISSPLLEERRHRLEVSVPAQGLVVHGDPTLLAQAVANLLANAAKCSEGFGGRIGLHAVRDGAEVVIRVSDDGIGIAAEMLPHIFELFAREQQTSDRTRAGLGLGLTIVRTFVEMHGGSVAVRSAGHGQGSEFSIRLPAALEASVAAASGPRPALFEPPIRKPDPQRVLVVDDNTDAAELLAATLEFLGHEARIAHDGPSALAVVASFSPDLAVLDIGLPVMDGYELGRRLRELPNLAGVRLVALTGYGQASDRQRSLEAGFQAHLVKPVQLAQLEAIIERREA
ncbi:MAG: PAS domain-containing protein [Myxococcales bacterium]